MYHAGVRYITIVLLCSFLLPGLLFAERQPVLKQIDLPHSYYYREMYLPQLTTGPSSVTWSPDSKQVLYSMGGSLWRQAIDSAAAEQLTDGPGYDYQPDWSPDGNWVIFTRYNKDAVELCLLDLRTKEVHALTNSGAVNLEPRWSPDGKQIAFVSTAGTGHLHIFAISIENGQPGAIRQLTQEHKSDLPRYYYSAFDHEISPAWSPDGSELIYISNKGHIHGTGGFWRMKAAGGEAREIRYEETTWKARPDWSPDGKRVIYSSYLGRNWHQLWIMTADGGDPFPLSYGDFDITAPRWSHDGSMIAFISNETGNTTLWIQKSVGGERKQLVTKERKYMHPTGHLTVVTLDPQGKQTPARILVTAEDGRAYAPEDAWMRADDSFDRKERPFEAHYFHSAGKSVLTVPTGKISVDVMKGLEFGFEQTTTTIDGNDNKVVILHLKRLQLPAEWKNWVSNDLHVHMNYAGTYRNTPDYMLEQAAAEDLDVVHNLIVNKEQRIPDIAYFTPKPFTAHGALLLESQEFHTSFWGHLGMLGLQDHILIPDYAAYPNTPAASLYPTNAVVSDLTHAQNGLAGYVHPFDAEPDPFKDPGMSERELPADAALGKVDYYEVVGFADHKASAAVWYRMLNCGLRIPTGSGTDAMSNYASLRGPVGLNRVYVDSHGSMKREDVLDALKKGRTFATNGPLLSFSVNGKPIGSELKFPQGTNSVSFTASLRSIVPVDHFEIVYNGKVVQQIALTGDGKSENGMGNITVDKSGWLILRAYADKAIYPVLDLYPYATTSPIYITVGDQPTRSPEDARYFVAWLDRIIKEATDHKGYNTDREKEETLKVLTDGRAFYAKQLQ